MVGSRCAGCQKCVSRRMKCDETSPVCRLCTHLGFECPGYQPQLVFIQMSALQIQRWCQDRKGSSSRSGKNRPPRKGHNLNGTIGIESRSGAGVFSTMFFSARYGVDRVQSAPFVSMLPFLDNESDLFNLSVNRLNDWIWYTKNWLKSICQWLMGEMTSSSSQALTTAYAATVYGDEPLQVRGCKRQGKSLEQLQRIAASRRI